VPAARRKGVDLLPAEGEEDAPRIGAACGHRPGDILDDLPAVARRRGPRRPAERDQPHPGEGRRRHGVPRDLVGEGMSRIDQHVDAFCPEMAGEAVDPAEAADPHRHRMGYDLLHPAGERDGDGEAGRPGKPFRQFAGLGRAAKNEDASRHEHP
jgi:hypothetical protein